MTFDEFERQASAVYEAIPPEFKEGVDGLSVREERMPHPTLPDIWTMGECRTEAYPADWGHPDVVRSIVVLYYGSFAEIASRSDDFDWDEEIWETITHEIRHHLEWLAREDDLEVQDYVEDENFKRRAGEAFDPFFYRSGFPVADDVFEVGGDVFFEQGYRPDDSPAGEVMEVYWYGDTIRVPVPDELAEVQYLTLEGAETETGQLVLVLVRERTRTGLLRGLFPGGGSVAQQSPVTAVIEERSE